MPRAYHELLPIIFKRFSVRTGLRTGIPTLHYYLKRPALPPSDKPALFTMNILPPMMTVWHHLARKNLGDAVDITIFDCSGTLNPREFPGVRVQKFLNLYASAKCDEFLRSIARNRRIGWLCDDDVFFTGPGALHILQREFAIPNTATISFRDRGWWRYEINNNTYPVSGSYCLAIDRSIFIDKEHLTLAPTGGNTHPSNIDKVPVRYDTGDKANEILLSKGYRCAIVPRDEADRCITVFTGMSGAVVLLWHFRTPEQTLTYFRTPPNKNWGGTLLYGLLSSMLCICTIQECYEKLTGAPYPLPSLPPRRDLEAIAHEKEKFLTEGRTFRWAQEVGQKLKQAL